MKVRRPTLKSVAVEAGVSVSTASIVFSGKGPVAAETRDRVLAAAARLGYLGPDPMAARLRLGRADVVGVVVTGAFKLAFQDPYALSVADGLATELDRIGSGMLLLSQDPHQPLRLLDRLRGMALDGLVFMAPGDNPVVAELAGRGLPMVGLGAYYDDPVIRIDIDNRAAMRPMAEHVHALGHRRLAVLSLPLRPSDLAGARRDPQRLEAALVDPTFTDLADRLRAVGDVFGPDTLTMVCSGFGVEEATSCVGALLERPVAERPTAIIAMSDQLALGVLRAAADRRLRVPDDLSVTGFDGILLPHLAEGQLTTIVQPGAEKGVLAVQAVTGGHPESRVLPSHLRVGTTSGPPGA